jgi:hypothetical protein
MAEEPTQDEINEIIRLANKGRRATTMDDDTWKQLEDYLITMKNRGVNLNQINDILEKNSTTVDKRPLREYIADRIKYIESGEEDAIYIIRRTQWKTKNASTVGGVKSRRRRQKKIMKKSNKSRTRRYHKHTRRR